MQRSSIVCTKRRSVEMAVKLLLLGDAGVGKTSFSRRLVTGKYHHNYKWTLGVDFALKVVRWSDDVSIKLQLWDIAGQERFTSMTRVYYKDAHACIIMFDLTHRQTFQNALKWKKDLDSKCTLADGNLVPCILLANKCDLPHHEVGREEIEKVCKDNAFIGWTETSVKEAIMIEESMRFLLEEMMLRYTEIERSYTSYENSDSVSNIKIWQSPKSENEVTDRCAC